MWGGGSNAIGLFHPFIDDDTVAMTGVEAGGKGLASGEHAAPICKGKIGVLHGSRSYVMSNKDGQITEPYSISAGLDYPGKGPEHAWLHHIKRANYVNITDKEALEAFHELVHLEGIIPALESSHALAHGKKVAKDYKAEEAIIINLSGRGDKDLHQIAEYENIDLGTQKQ